MPQPRQSDVDIARIAEVQKLKTLLKIARGGLEYLLEHHLNGEECLCVAARATAAAAFSISDPDR